MENAAQHQRFHPSFDVNDNVVIVTGAGQGIGRAFARNFALAGAVSVVAELNLDKARAVVAEIEEAGGTALAVKTDVGDPESLQQMAREVAEKLGRVDVLINNAGIFSTLKMQPFEEIPPEEWDRVLEVNISGVFHACRAVAPYMRQAGRGRIINMASGAVTMGRPNYLHYITSKSALIGMTRSLARELGDYGITVNTIMPGAIVTEIPRETVTPEQRERLTALQCIRRPGTPEDLVGAAMFLASNAAAFVTGQALTVDGGATHP
jgi:NAD(P)-dependent dehydrogenase (short-subunit alcohol dehydrogenase family)